MVKREKNQVSESAAYEAIRVAQCHEHVGDMASSAALAARDAMSLFNSGDFKYAFLRALDSLSYSVGRYSHTYRDAEALAFLPESR